MKKIFQIVILFVLLGSLNACFHKDVMSDTADDVKQVLLFSENGKTYIITLESIFQANSKESNGGTYLVSGHSEYRLTTYSAENGTIVSRVDLGEGMEENENHILGCFDGKLWMYGLGEDLGLHCRDPKTLAVLQNEKKLKETGDLKNIQLARPTWAQLADYYGWIPGTKEIIITDQQGFHYRYNTGNQAIVKTEEKPPHTLASKNVMNDQAYYNIKKVLSTAGDQRKTLQFGYTKKEGNPSYISPSYIIDRNDLRYTLLDSVYNNMLQTGSLKIKQVADSITAEKDKTSETYRNVLNNKLENLKREMEKFERDMRSMKLKTDHIMRDKLLQPDDDTTTCFIWHAASISDTAHAIITRLKLNAADSTFQEKWSCNLNGICYNPSKADQKTSSEKVFSDGNPTFDFQWFECSGTQLIFITQLRMCCIDMATGKLLWNIEL